VIDGGRVVAAILCATDVTARRRNEERILELARRLERISRQVPGVVEVEKVKDNLYVISNGGGNTAVFVGEKGVTLVDTKNPNWGERIMEKVNASGDPAVRASCLEFVLAGLYAMEKISRAQQHGRMVTDEPPECKRHRSRWFGAY